MQFDMESEQKESRSRFYDQQARDRMSLIKGGLRILCAPLILRKGSVHDIVGITGFSRCQVYTQRRLMRYSGELPALTPQALHDMKVEAYKPKPISGTPEYNDEQIGFTLARRLIDAGFIARDTTMWGRVYSLYERYGRVMPADFATRIRLEAFLVVHQQWRKGDQLTLIRFGEALKTTNPALLQDTALKAEHQFIIDAIEIEYPTRRMNYLFDSYRQKRVLASPVGGGPVEFVLRPTT